MENKNETSKFIPEKLKEQGQNLFLRILLLEDVRSGFKNNNYDKWILARDGEKVLSDKVELYYKTRCFTFGCRKQYRK